MSKPDNDIDKILLEFETYRLNWGEANAAILRLIDKAVLEARIEQLKFTLSVAQEIDSPVGIGTVIYNEIKMLEADLAHLKEKGSRDEKGISTTGHDVTL